MIELFEQDIRTNDRQSSKGNQLKWRNGEIWYKADYTGYEGLAEYVVSALLVKSSLNSNEFVKYVPEQIKYKKNIFNGVSSCNFVTDDWQIITLERLFKNMYNQSFYESVWHIHDIEERFLFICNEVKKMTGLTQFDKYMAKLMTIDGFFMNEDRHMHNIAVLMNSRQEFTYCPIFDNGACLLSDTSMDFPLGQNTYELMKECHGRTFSEDFDEQLDVAEKICGINITFSFAKNDVKKLLEGVVYYSEDIKKRVCEVLFFQMDKYGYLFGK